MTAVSREFFDAYANHRAMEGRALGYADWNALPYLRSGFQAQQWSVRARSYDALIRRLINPLGKTRALDILDLGAGNGWLCNRLAQHGHKAVALDIREDRIDGLGAARNFLEENPGRFVCVGASFDELPFADSRFDVVIFNASLHYATDLGRTLAEARRVTRSGGTIAIIDSPFYNRAEDGEAMIAEKRKHMHALFGERAEILLGPNFVEFLTQDRLAAAFPILSWRRQRVRYPLRYEIRPLAAWARRRRRPSRFDLWTARVP